MPTGRGEGPVYRIIDGAGLKRALADAMKHYASQAEASKLAGIGKATLWRLLAGKETSITQTTLDGLFRLVGRPGKGSVIEAAAHGRLTSCLLSPVALSLLESADTALQAELAQSIKHAMPWRWVSDQMILEKRDSKAKGVDIMRWKELAVLEWLARKKFGNLIPRFEASVLDRGHHPVRVQLSIVRALLPLVVSAEFGFVERHWSELRGEAGDWKELRAYVEAGLKRELILLERSPDEQRAQEVADTPEEFDDDERIHVLALQEGTTLLKIFTERMDGYPLGWRDLEEGRSKYNARGGRQPRQPERKR